MRLCWYGEVLSANLDAQKAPNDRIGKMSLGHKSIPK